MNNQHFFPQKLAIGSHFCNRKQEQKHLAANIEAVRPSLIISPRRYGKTSLGMSVIRRLNLPHSHIDLFPLMNLTEIEQAIINGLAEILSATETNLQKAIALVSQLFADLNISFKVNNANIEIDHLSAPAGTSRMLHDALQQVDKQLAKKNLKAVLFLDEFQRLGQFDGAERVEGVLRNIAQQSTHLCFLFSGSNRHLLSKIFEDSKRPFFKLCDKIALGRISAADFSAFILKSSVEIVARPT